MTTNIAPVVGPPPTVSAALDQPSRLLDEVAEKTQRGLALRPVDGSLTEKIAAFKEMANSLVHMQLNGWNTVPRCLAACWLADGLGIHPALYIQHHWVADFGKGGDPKIVVTPQWPFLLALLRSRVAGFRFKMLTDTAEKCVVWMSNGRDEHTEPYDLDDAKRQGLLDGKFNAWKGGNTREMCRAKAIRRAANIIGPEAMVGIPSGGDEDVNDAPPTKSAPVAPEAPTLERAAVAEDWNETLRTELRARCGGGMTGKKMLEKSNVVRNLLQRDAITEPPTADQAREIVEFLREHFGASDFPATPEQQRNDPLAGASARKAEPHGYAEDGPPHTAGLIDEEAPKPTPAVVPVQPLVDLEDSVPEPEPDRDETPEQAHARMDDTDGKVATLLRLVELAKKHSDATIRKTIFVKEAPAGTGQFHFVHKTILQNMGEQFGVFIVQSDGTQAPTFDAEKCRKIVRAVRALGIAEVAEVARHSNR